MRLDWSCVDLWSNLSGDLMKRHVSHEETHTEVQQCKESGRMSSASGYQKLEKRPGTDSPSQPFSQFSSVQSLSHVQLFATLWIAARQASLSITNSRSSLRLTSIESVMPSSHLILCRPLLLPPIPPSIRVFFQWVNFSHEVAKVLEFQL